MRRLASAKRLTPAEAAALVRPRDRLAVPLGPGQPAAFLHALGERDDFEDLHVFGALLTGLYKVFTRRGVHLRSGFFGPVERGLRKAGFDVQFVPADFRRFSHIVRDFRPRILSVMAAPPDEKGMISFGLHAGLVGNFPSVISPKRRGDLILVAATAYRVVVTSRRVSVESNA